MAASGRGGWGGVIRVNVAHERALAGAAILDDSIARLLLAEFDDDGRRGATAGPERHARPSGRVADPDAVAGLGDDSDA